MLSEWIKVPSNKQVFKDFVQTHYAITYNMNNPNTEKLLLEFLSVIHKEKPFTYRLRNRPVFKYVAAAMLVGIIVSGYFTI